MKSLPWFRLYTEMIDDEKLGLLAFEDRWHFVALLCLKGKGVLDNEPDVEMLARKVALKMGLTCAELEKVAGRLSRMGLIDFDTFQPTAWDSRQFSSDQDGTAAERQKRFRESRKRNALRNGDGNAPVTRLDTDTDTDKETEREEKTRANALPTFSLPDWINQSHWDAWHSCPKRKKATNAQKQMAVEKLDAWRQTGIDYAAALENAAIGGWQGLFKPDSKRPPAVITGGRRTPQADNFQASDYGQGGKL